MTAGGEYSDVDLMLRFQGGDEDAFVELVKRHQESTLNLIYRYIADRTEAEDLAQEVFLKVYRQRVSYRPTAKFSTWLYRIVVNLCLNEIRDRRRMVVGNPPEEVVGQGDEKDIPEGVSRVELERAVKAAVQSLPEHQRIAVLLVKYEGMSYEDAAETMGVSLEALKSLIFRSKEGLKRMLERYVGE